jgi:hypothetical protein
VIRDVATLLEAIQQKELEAIRNSGITHAPTVGAQYEGVTSSILKIMIPAELQLQVVSGFVEGVGGSLSGQIDCMLVQGQGTPVPSVPGLFKWPIKDVLAVIEVKKTLFGDDLADAHDQLRGVMDLFWQYAETLGPGNGIDITAPMYVYGQIVGEPAPSDWRTAAMPTHKEALYRMLLDDHVAPVRIILGYGGFKTEDSLRQGFLRFLSRNAQRHGFAGSSLPSLIVCGNNSILKTNGQPFYLHPWKDRYLCYASSGRSPLLWILNLILTRISHLRTWRNWYTGDLSIDRFAPLLWGKATGDGSSAGWEYWEHPISAKDLKQVPPLTAEEWQPTKITEDQALLLGLVGNDGIARQDVLDAMAISATQEQAIKMIDDLVAKRLLGWDNETLVFLTQRCATIFTPRDGLIAHDLEDQRLAEWMAKPERWSTTAT